MLKMQKQKPLHFDDFFSNFLSPLWDLRMSAINRSVTQMVPNHFIKCRSTFVKELESFFFL